MEIYIALFRGINVGGKNLLSMKELKDFCISLGLIDARTYIQSGNLVFKSPEKNKSALKEKLRSIIEREKGFAPELILLSVEEWKKAIRNCPYALTRGKSLHGYFLQRCPENPDLDRLKRLRGERESFLLNGFVFYLHAPDGIGRSRMAAAVESALGVPVTARNGNSLLKISAMLD